MHLCFPRKYRNRSKVIIVSFNTTEFQIELSHLNNIEMLIYLPTFSEMYKREIFILGVLGFLKMTIPKKSEFFRRSPKFSEDLRSLPNAKLSRKCLSTLLAEAFPLCFSALYCHSLRGFGCSRFVLVVSRFTHDFHNSLHGSELTYFWK